MAQDPNLSTNAEDVVAIFDEDFAQVLADAIVINLSVEEPTAFFDHPLETSVIRTDHVITLPNVVTIEFILPSELYRAAYAEAQQLKIRQDVLFIQTKSASYTNMQLQVLSQEQTPDKYDVIPMTITFREAQIFNSVVQQLATGNVQDPASASTVDRGNQQAETPGPSLAAQAFDNISGFFQ